MHLFSDPERLLGEWAHLLCDSRAFLTFGEERNRDSLPQVCTNTDFLKRLFLLPWSFLVWKVEFLTQSHLRVWSAPFQFLFISFFGATWIKFTSFSGGRRERRSGPGTLRAHPPSHEVSRRAAQEITISGFLGTSATWGVSYCLWHFKRVLMSQ